MMINEILIQNRFIAVSYYSIKYVIMMSRTEVASLENLSQKLSKDQSHSRHDEGQIRAFQET